MSCPNFTPRSFAHRRLVFSVASLRPMACCDLFVRLCPFLRAFPQRLCSHVFVFVYFFPFVFMALTLSNYHSEKSSSLFPFVFLLKGTVLALVEVAFLLRLSHHLVLLLCLLFLLGLLCFLYQTYTKFTFFTRQRYMSKSI